MRGGTNAVVALSQRRWLTAGMGGAERPARAIAVIGGGLAGLAVTYHMLDFAKGRGDRGLGITIIDQSEVGLGGASGAMAGILHNGDEGMEASLKLLGIAARHSGASLRTHGHGVVHLARDQRQEDDFRKAASNMPAETELLSASEADRLRGFLEGAGGASRIGLRVKRGCAVRGSEYTKALLAACRELGHVSWEVEQVESIASVAARGFDDVIVCAGAACLDMDELRGRVPIKRARAQNIDFVRKEGREDDAGSLDTPIICGKYLVPFEGPDGGVLCGGSTREEHEGSSDVPDLRRALEELHEPLSALFEPIRTGAWEPSQAKAGVKCLSPRLNEGRIPCVGKLRLLTAQDTSFWLFTGLGSRGLIHHAVLGELLARAVLLGDESVFADVTNCRLRRGLIHHAVLGELLARAVLLGDESVLPDMTRRLPILGGQATAAKAPGAMGGTRKGQ